MIEIREARHEDWDAVFRIFSEIVADGRTYAYPEDLSSSNARELWMKEAPGRTVVALVDGAIAASAHMGPNRPGRGSHVATASFMVGSAARSQGLGRALGEEMIAWARDAGYRGIQFNAVVETNAAAVALWQSLGFEIVGTVPQAFDDREHGLVGLHVMYLAL